MCDHFNISPGRRGTDKSAPGRQRLSRGGCQCVGCVASPLTDQIVRMRGESVKATSLIHCGDVTDAAGGTAMLHLGKTRAAQGLSLLAKVGSGSSSTREKKMEAKPKKIANRFIWPVRGVLWFSPRGTCKSIIEQSKDNSYYTHRTL